MNQSDLQELKLELSLKAKNGLDFIFGGNHFRRRLSDRTYFSGRKNVCASHFNGDITATPAGMGFLSFQQKKKMRMQQV